MSYNKAVNIHIDIRNVYYYMVKFTINDNEGLVTNAVSNVNYGEGGYKKGGGGGGGACEVLPRRKGGAQKVLLLAMLKGVGGWEHTKYWGSFYAVA